MKRVLVFSHEFPPILGGAGSVAKRNVGVLAGSGVETHVLTQLGADEMEGVSFIRLKVVSRLWFLSYVFFLIARKKWLRSFDLILLNDPASIYIAGLCMPKDVLRKSLAFMHGSEVESIFEQPSAFKRIQLFPFFFSRAVSNSKKVIFPSEWLREKFLKHTSAKNRFGVNEVVYAGINLDVFYEMNSNVRAELGILNDDLLILSVSRVIAKKGYPEMYNVFKRLRESGVEYHWVIIGAGAYLEKLKVLVKNDGLDQYVHFLGGIPQAELKKYYSAADVFLLLSQFEEAFGLVYLEACASGTPSVALQKGGVSEAVLEGTTGFVIDSVEDCFELLSGSAWKALNKKNMKAFVERVCDENLLTLEEFGFFK